MPFTAWAVESINPLHSHGCEHVSPYFLRDSHSCDKSWPPLVHPCYCCPWQYVYPNRLRRSSSCAPEQLSLECQSLQSDRVVVRANYQVTEQIYQIMVVLSATCLASSRSSKHYRRLDRQTNYIIEHILGAVLDKVAGGEQFLNTPLPNTLGYICPWHPARSVRDFGQHHNRPDADDDFSRANTLVKGELVTGKYICQGRTH